ncbi:glycosyltransferase family 2 protein [Candidatus Woesearchaeota archaeon]|jgi:hypothetical protein|nr:glycosyltransferase family 2 protein [Candidatus Woesearchaeota archaeon]
MAEITVIYSIYGSFDKCRLEASIGSVLAQKDVDLEIIVAEQGSYPRHRVPNDKRVKHHFEKFHPTDNNFNPGAIRNMAGARASGEFIYTNDADIVFLDKNYLRNIIELLDCNEDLSLYRPLMLRLSLNEFKQFFDSFKDEGLNATLGKLKQPNDYFLSFHPSFPELKVVVKQAKYEKTFVATQEDFQRYLSDHSLKGSEPTIFYENLHCGGIATRLDLFRQVGGYCEQFENWGCEDSDLQWKLSKIGKLDFFPKDKRYQVLHLDHPKGYFRSEKWRQNEEKEAIRKKRDFIEVLRGDVLDFNRRR